MSHQLQTVHVFGPDNDADAAWRLLDWCVGVGADDFTVAGIGSGDPNAEPFRAFDTIADRWRRPPEARRHLSGPPNSGLVFATDLWALNQETILALKAAFPRGLFDYYPGADAWFEDLEVYRRGELLLGIITHEQEGLLRLTTEESAELLERGLVLRSQGKWVGY